MLNYFYIIDMIHHKENAELLKLYDHKKLFFNESVSLFEYLPEKNLHRISPILCKVTSPNLSVINTHLEAKKTP